jgi:hypothetical protein
MVHRVTSPGIRQGDRKPSPKGKPSGFGMGERHKGDRVEAANHLPIDESGGSNALAFKRRSRPTSSPSISEI